MLTCEKMELARIKRTNMLNKRLDEIRGLDDSVNEDNSFTESGKRLILISAYFIQWSLISTASKNYKPMIWLIRTFPRLGTIKELQDKGLFDMMEEVK